MSVVAFAVLLAIERVFVSIPASLLGCKYGMRPSNMLTQILHCHHDHRRSFAMFSCCDIVPVVVVAIVLMLATVTGPVHAVVSHHLVGIILDIFVYSSYSDDHHV